MDNTVVETRYRNIGVLSSHARMQSIKEYSWVIFLSIFILFFLMGFWGHSFFQFPFSYSSDALYHLMMTKSVISSGWYLTNPFIGAPEGHFLFDFPFSDGLNFLIIKALTLFSSNPFKINNIFYVLSFPFSAVTALFVLKRFDLRFPLALTGSLLFAFTPFHFFRGTIHLFFSSYFMVPLVIWLASLVYQNKLFSKENPQYVFFSRNTFWFIGYSILCLLLGSTGIYYSFFGSFFLVVAGVIASFRQKKLFPFGLSLFFVFLITSTIIFNVLPTLLFHLKHGNNLIVAQRFPVESELYGLKLAQLLLPIQGDRIDFLAGIRQYYDTGVLINENGYSSLGLIGSIGFLILLGSVFVIRKKFEQHSEDHYLEGLTLFNLSGILLATVGGGGSLFALLISPKIRCFNRISIFLAFFALAGFFLVLQKWLEKKRWHEKKSLVALFCAVLLLFGIFNQTPRSFSGSRPVASQHSEFLHDQAFFLKLDQLLTRGSMVFQLPYLPFPESPPQHHMPDYDHFKAALHSKMLRWSYGAIKGRETDFWQKEVSSYSPMVMVDALVQKGFKAIYINRNGYPDHGKSLENHLRTILGEPLLISQNLNQSVWALPHQ